MAISVVQTNSDGWFGFSEHRVIFASAPTAGNLLVAFISYAADPGTLTLPSGWATIAALYNVPNFDHFIGSYYKVAGASESATHAWTYTGSVFPAVSASLEISGTHTAAPFEVIVPWTQLGNFSGTGPFTVASMTTLSAGAVDLVVVNERDDGPGYVCDTAGYTEQVDADGFGLYSKEIASAGATGTRAVRINAGFNCDVFNLSIKAGAAAPDPSFPPKPSAGRRPAPFKPGLPWPLGLRKYRGQ